MLHNLKNVGKNINMIKRERNVEKNPNGISRD